MFRRVLFCPPDHYEVREVKNPWMNGDSPVDRVLARQQWEQVRSSFSSAGLELAAIEPAPGLEDMVFVANQVFVGRTPGGELFIVPSRMGHPSRQPEVQHFVGWFRDRGYRVIDLGLSGDQYLEGHGDLLWHADGSRIWAGYGFRSSRSGVEKFAAAMDSLDLEVLPLELVDERFYHLDTCLAPLTADAILIYPGAFSPAAFERIQENCLRVYEVSAEDALGFVCNGVAAGDRFITPHLTPRLANALEREGLEPVVVDTSEFQKSGGSVCCLKLFVD